MSFTKYTGRIVALLFLTFLALFSTHTFPFHSWNFLTHPLGFRTSYPRGTSVFQPDNLTKDLVVPSLQLEDTTWISHLIPPWLHMTPKIYHVDLPPSSNSSALRVPKNKGNEVMTYLTYIITHYDTLPDIVVFAHSHPGSPHNSPLHLFSTPIMLRELNYHRVQRIGYMNLRCEWQDGCPAWIETRADAMHEDKMEELFFSTAFQELFGADTAVPPVFAGACCAQFAVSRDAIRRHDKAQYERWREWLLKTRMRDAFAGRIWERLWQYVFTGRAVECPEERVCYCDGYGLCFGGDREWQRFAGERRGLEAMERIVSGGAVVGPEVKARVQLGERELERRVKEARWRGRSEGVRREEVGEEFSG